MSTLSDALAAMECERVHLIEAAKRYMKAYGPGYSTTDTLPYDALVGVLSAVSTDPAPDTAAWIEKALPLFEDAKTAIEAAYGKGSKLVDALDALLAEAKGEGK